MGRGKATVLALAVALLLAVPFTVITNKVIYTQELKSLSGKEVLNLNNGTAWLNKLETPSVAWNFSKGEYPVSTATVVVYKDGDHTVAKGPSL